MRVLEDSSVERCLRVSAATLRSINWERITDYKYEFEGPMTMRDALRRLEIVIGQYLHSCAVDKSPLYEIDTEMEAARGREVLQFTGRRSKHAYFYQYVYYTDKCSVLADLEIAALERGGWRLVNEERGRREFEKAVGYKDPNLRGWEVKNMGIDDWEKLLPTRSWDELESGRDEWERCGTCSYAKAHGFE